MGGRLHTGLGEGLLDRGFEVRGRELFGEFKSLPFQDKLGIVANDLQKNFWHEESCVIANSFGAYLLLNTQAQIEPYIGRVILLSPILGSFSNEETLNTFVPPHADRIFELAKAKLFPTPKNCEIHVGELDWQSPAKAVGLFGELLGLKVHIVPNAGHMLPKEYVGALLDAWV